MFRFFVSYCLRQRPFLVKLALLFCLSSYSCAQSTEEEDKNKKENQQDLYSDKKKEEEEGAKKEQKDEHNAGDKKTGEFIPNSEEYFVKKPFFNLAPIEISIFKNDEPISSVRIESTIETKEEEWERIRLLIPVFFDRLFVDLYHNLNNLWDKSTPIQVPSLKKRFQFVGDTVFGKDNLKSVLIGLILVTPNKK